MHNENSGDENKGKQGAEIREYGTTLAPSSPIHIISVIGQIEGTYPSAPRTTRQPNMSTCCRS